MKFTDLFVKRPVLAIVVNLVILIAGLQSIRALSVRQYPRSDIAVVKVGSARGDQIAVLSGVNAGDEIVTSGLFKLRNGAAVQVNNKVKPGNNSAPKPENS